MFLLTYLLDESDNDSFLFWGTTAADDSRTSGGKLHNFLHIELETFLEKRIEFQTCQTVVIKHFISLEISS